MELRAYISSALFIPGDCHRQELEKRRPVRSAKAEKNMVSTRTATCLVVLLWAAAGWGNPLPQEDPTDVPAQYDSLLLEDSEATTSALGENEQDEAFTAGQAGQDTTVTMSEENSTSENDTEEEIAASGQDFGRPSPSDDTEAAPQDDSLYPEESEGEGTELESENERKRREESSTSKGEVFGVNVEEESSVDDRASESTNSSEEESSTNTPPSNPLDKEADQSEAESVEVVKVAAVRSGDAVISEENQETDNEPQETTVEFEDLTEEKAETGVTESGETVPDDPSSESEVDGRRRRRRVPLKEADLENKSLGNDTEQNVNESVKSVALN